MNGLQPMVTENPFTDLDTARQYESWYCATGKQAAKQEKQLIRLLISKVVGVLTVLDVGCGTGYFTDWYSQLGLRAFGCDRSPAMIHAGLRLHPFDACLGDALSLPFPTDAVDLVSFVTTLEFVTDLRLALSEGLRVARKGLVLGAINRQSLLGWRYRRKGGPIWGAAHFFTPGELLRLVSEILSQPYNVVCKTTLWPVFKGSSRLPWGGFMGLAVILS